MKILLERLFRAAVLTTEFDYSVSLRPVNIIHPVPPTVSASTRKVGWPTPTGTD